MREFLQEKKVVIYSTIAFYMLSHAFGFLNVLYSEDSLLIKGTGDGWQISIGRYLQLFYIRLRGQINSPWMIAIFALLYLLCVNLLIVDLFQVESKNMIIVICGLLSTNVTMISLIATYINFTDIFMLAIFLAVFGVWATIHWKTIVGIVIGSIAVTISLGLYQSYLTVFITLSMLVAIRSLLQGETVQKVSKIVLRLIAVVALGAFAYYIGLKTVLTLTGIELANSYNGLTSLGDFTGVSVYQLIRNTYIFYIKNFISLETIREGIISFLNVLLGLTVFFGGGAMLSKKAIKA